MIDVEKLKKIFENIEDGETVYLPAEEFEELKNLIRLEGETYDDDGMCVMKYSVDDVKFFIICDWDVLAKNGLKNVRIEVEFDDKYIYVLSE